ncbi:MAG: ABC transporter ATP-binding protein [Pseudolysinimonas sp.]
MTEILLSDVSKTFKGRRVLRDVTLAIEAGRSYAITGPNGSGKSVLLKLMCKLLLPSSGRVVIDPKYLSASRTFPDRFGVSIDGPAYLPGLTGEDNLRELARIRNRVGDVEIGATMDDFGLERGRKTKVRAYSMGMKQKLSLIQAVMERPDVLILDEPFNALDTSSRARATSVLRGHLKGGGTLVFTSHYESEVSDLADEVYSIDTQHLVKVS